jgi:hypothetical protein
MRKDTKKLFVGVMFAILVSTGFAQQVAEVAEKKTGWDFDAGADLRFRYEYRDNLMDKGKTSVSPLYEDYSRTRTRVWGKATYGEDLGAYIRLGNEFRDYRNAPDNDKNKFPDELYIDNLYFDFKNLGDRVTCVSDDRTSMRARDALSATAHPVTVRARLISTPSLRRSRCWRRATSI